MTTTATAETTAALRSRAWEAQESGAYALAADLYERAASSYPRSLLASGQAFGQADHAKLMDLARRNRSMAN